MKTWIDFLGGKKFIVVLICTFLSFIALLMGKISGEVWKYIILGLPGIYVTGNVVQKVKTPK